MIGNVIPYSFVFGVWAIEGFCLFYMLWTAQWSILPIQLYPMRCADYYVLWSACEILVNFCCIIVDGCHHVVFSLVEGAGSDRRVLQVRIFVTLLYRVTHRAVLFVLLTLKQKFRFSIPSLTKTQPWFWCQQSLENNPTCHPYRSPCTDFNFFQKKVVQFSKLQFLTLLIAVTMRGALHGVLIFVRSHCANIVCFQLVLSCNYLADKVAEQNDEYKWLESLFIGKPLHGCQKNCMRFSQRIVWY